MRGAILMICLLLCIVLTAHYRRESTDARLRQNEQSDALQLIVNHPPLDFPDDDEQDALVVEPRLAGAETSQQYEVLTSVED